MAQENGPRDKADELRDYLILAGVPDWREEAEQELYAEHVQREEDVERG